jgi:hypothetical protein
MATQVQNRRGTTAEHSTFTGAVGELTVDTTKDVVVVHDGSTAGGFPTLRQDQANLPTSAPSNGVYIPSSNNVAISTNSSQRLLIDASGNISATGTATAASFIPTSSTVPANGMYLKQANEVAFAQNSTTRLIIGADGQVYVGAFDTSAAVLNIGAGATGNRYAQLDLVGDTTYTDAGFRILRDNTGANAVSYIVHRGTGELRVITQEAGAFGVHTNSVERFKITGAGKSRFGVSAYPHLSNVELADDLGFLGYGNTIYCGRAFGPTSEGGDNTWSTGTSRLLVQGWDGGQDSVLLFTPGTQNNTQILHLRSSGEIIHTANVNQATVVRHRSGTNAASITNAGFGVSYEFYESRDGYSGGIIYTNSSGAWNVANQHYPTSFYFATGQDYAAGQIAKMAIDQFGQVLITSRYVPQYITTVAAPNTSNILIIGYANGTIGTFAAGTTTFIVYSNGTVQNSTGSYGTISDAKNKENIVDANSQWDDIKSIRVRNFNFKESIGLETIRQIGVVAQEVELVSPGLVYETEDKESVEVPVLDENGDSVLDHNGNPATNREERSLGTTTKSVRTSVLYMKALKALQEAMERIEQLEAKVVALEGA